LATDFVLDALDQAIYDRCPAITGDLVHHSDRGTQYVSMRYTERLADAGIEPSVGSRGDSYDNALAESVIGLFKTEVIRRKGPWRHLEAVEFATLDWVDWFNHRRLLEPSATCHRPSTRHATMSRPPRPDSHNRLSDKPGTIQFHRRGT
jgi:transposase InsO family protein